MCPIDYSNYPDNWKAEIRPAILERANNRCEFCGVENGAVGKRDKDGAFHTSHEIKCMSYSVWRKMFTIDAKTITIVLTIAHLDHDTTNNDDDNLRALCQKCHLTYDAKHHAKNAAITRRRKYEDETGQMRMFE